MVFYFKKDIKKKKNSGFVMLFSAVVSSILLAIALGVANIAVKELAFDTSAKRTNDAFFAADTAVECALYHDLATGDESAFGKPSIELSATCAGTDVDLNNDATVPTTGPWDFVLFLLAPSGNACAKVNVTKTVAPDPESTVIVARGYNLGGNTDDCSSSNQNRVERELQVTIGEPPGPPVYYTLDVAVSGPPNSGTVTSDVGSISCPGACSASYLANTLVTLTAVAQPGYALTGWSDPACPGTGACAITMSADKSITATFGVSTSYPTIAGVTSSSQNGNTANHNIALPAPVSGNGSGDLLIAMFSVDGESPPLVINWTESGWNQIGFFSNSNGTHIFEVRYKIANGTEGATTLVTTSGNERSAHRAFRITDHGHSVATPPEISMDVSFGQNPDSPNLAPTWGSAKTLWMSAVGRHNGDSNATIWPAGYTSYPTIRTGNFTLGVAEDTATLFKEDSSENPGTFTLDSSNNAWIAMTIAIKGL